MSLHVVIKCGKTWGTDPEMACRGGFTSRLQTPWAARREAAEHGWGRDRDGVDLCPAHVLSEEVPAEIGWPW